jgi:hypothetical protein
MLEAEFVRRLFLHIVPRGVNRVRYAGLFYCGGRATRLELCRQLIESMSGPTRESKPLRLMSQSLTSGASGYSAKCKVCGATVLRDKGFRSREETHQTIDLLQCIILLHAARWTTIDVLLKQIVGGPANKFASGRTRANVPEQIWFEDWASDFRYKTRHSQVNIHHFISPVQQLVLHQQPSLNSYHFPTGDEAHHDNHCHAANASNANQSTICSNTEGIDRRSSVQAVSTSSNRAN